MKTMYQDSATDIIPDQSLFPNQQLPNNPHLQTIMTGLGKTSVYMNNQNGPKYAPPDMNH